MLVLLILLNIQRKEIKYSQVGTSMVV